MNERMREAGLQPLDDDTQPPPATPRPAPPPRLPLQLDDAEARGIQEVGLTEEEYEAIRGNSKLVMGLRISAVFYHRLMSACSSKKARALSKDDVPECRRFVSRKIKAIARKAALKAHLLKTAGLS